MKPIVLLVLFSSFAVAQMEPDPVLEQHKWLHQLVGEWTASGEIPMGEEAMTLESTETIRLLGDRWVVAESKSSMDGKAFKTMMTLGYDPKVKAFVGTWIDSMHNFMWHYRGTLDEAKKVLTLEAEGPSMMDPTKTARYRDIITIKGPDLRTLTSKVQGEDGSWQQFMEIEFKRKKQGGEGR